MLKKKILVVSNTAFSIEKFRIDYLIKLSKKYFIDIYSPDKFQYKSKRINTFGFGYKKIARDIFFFKKLLKKSYDFILVYSFKYQLILSLCNLFYNKNIIYIVAGRGSIFLIQNYFIRKFYETILKIFLNKKNYICFINPEDKKFFIKKYQLNIKKVFLIPSEGINCNIRNNNKKKNRKINFIFFSRILKEKGIEDYLEAAKIINKKYSNVNFYVAGPNQKKKLGQTFSLNLKDYKSLLKKNKSVKYLGYIKNYKKIFFKMDCLVAPSFTEGAGNSVLEAMISRLFIVAYNNAGHRFILKNTKNLVCKKNNVHELVKNIEKFININKKQLNKITLQSQKRVLNYFSTEIVFNKLKKILYSTIKLKS